MLPTKTRVVRRDFVAQSPEIDGMRSKRPVSGASRMSGCCDCHDGRGTVAMPLGPVESSACAVTRLSSSTQSQTCGAAVRQRGSGELRGVPYPLTMGSSDRGVKCDLSSQLESDGRQMRCATSMGALPAGVRDTRFVYRVPHFMDLDLKQQRGRISTHRCNAYQSDCSLLPTASKSGTGYGSTDARCSTLSR